MLSKTASTIFIFLFLLFFIAVTAYLETFQVERTDTGNFLTSYSVMPEENEVNANINEGEEDILNTIIPILEDRFVEREYIDDQVVEKYQEYEIYMDEKGNVIKTVPTSNFNYIRYYLTN